MVMTGANRVNADWPVRLSGGVLPEAAGEPPQLAATSLTAGVRGISGTASRAVT
jgi:hypothetical protein